MSIGWGACQEDSNDDAGAGQSRMRRDAMRAFTFAPQIRELARNLAHRVREKGPYNAVHLRLEEDLTVSYKDGLHGLQSAYLATLAQAGYSAETPIYIASGLSKANDPDSRDAQVRTLPYWTEYGCTTCAFD